jgi:hypothetical protein
VICDICANPAATVLHSSEGSGPVCLHCAPGSRLEVIAFEHLMKESTWEIMRPAHTCDDGDDCAACAREYAEQRRIDEAGRYQL